MLFGCKPTVPTTVSNMKPRLSVQITAFFQYTENVSQRKSFGGRAQLGPSAGAYSAPPDPTIRFGARRRLREINYGRGAKEREDRG